MVSSYAGEIYKTDKLNEGYRVRSSLLNFAALVTSVYFGICHHEEIRPTIDELIIGVPFLLTAFNDRVSRFNELSLDGPGTMGTRINIYGEYSRSELIGEGWSKSTLSHVYASPYSISHHIARIPVWKTIKSGILWTGLPYLAIYLV